jgi:hypothetical protein
MRDQLLKINFEQVEIYSYRNYMLVTHTLHGTAQELCLQNLVQTVHSVHFVHSFFKQSSVSQNLV